MNNQEFAFDAQLHPGSIKSAMRNAGAASRDLWQVPPGEIHIVEGFNVRIKDDAYRAHVRSIADSIKAEGFYQHAPLAGYVAKENGEDVIYAYDGHCRLEAVELAISEGAEIPVLPVSVSQAGLSMDDMIVAMVRSNSGKRLTTYETALVCKRLVRSGFDEKQIGDRLNLSAQYVSGLLSLVAAPAEVRNMVIAGKVAATTAIEMLAKHGEKATEKLEKAQELAGTKKVTAKHVIKEKTLKSEVSANAEKMFNILHSVHSDFRFGGLTPTNQEKVRGMMVHLNQFN